MSDKRKYQIMIGTVIIVFVYLLGTEVSSRLEATIGHYQLMSDREKDVLNPQELSSKKMDLVAQKRVLAARITHGRGRLEQNQIGVVKLINLCAKDKNILMQSLTPLESKTTGQMIEHGFRIEIIGTYHKLGAFLNALETGGIPIRITHIDAVSQRKGSAVIAAIIEGKAFVLSKEAVQ